MDVARRLEDLEARIARVEARLARAEPEFAAPDTAARASAPTATATGTATATASPALRGGSALASSPSSPSSPPPLPTPAPAVTPALTPEQLGARLARLERDTLAPRASIPAAAGAAPAKSSSPSSPPSSPPAIASAPRPAPAAPAAPAAPPRPPARPRPADASRPGPRTAIDYERFVGVAVLGRVGIAAVLLAAGYFGQLGWKEIGPAGKVGVVYGLAALFVGVGAALRTRVSRLYLALLWGGGTAAMYLAGVLAKLRFGLVGPTAAVGMLVAACAVGQFLASRARLQVLAVTALAGAFAAPVLVGGPEDARTVLCAYLLALHGWSAFTEARFGWKGARAVGVLGTGVVALFWLTTHGQADVSTALHVQAYLLGVTAPEWGRAILGRDVSAWRASLAFRLLATFEGLALLVSAFAASARDPVLTDVFPAVALAFAGLAAAARARAVAPTPMAVALARLAAFLLVPSACLVFRRGGVADTDAATGALAALGVLSLGLLAARRRFGLRDGGPVGAATFGVLVLAGLAHPNLRLLLALVTPAALVVRGRGTASRVAGHVAGAIAIVVGFLNVPSAWWATAAFGAVAAWAVVGWSARRWRRDLEFDLFVDASLAAAAGVWACLAFQQGPFLGVPQPLRDPGTVAALALAAVLAGRAPWRARPTLSRPSAAVAGSALVALVGLAAWRELHAALATHATASAQAGVETFFFVGTALAALVLGRRTGVRAFPALAAALLVTGMLRTLDAFEVRGDPWWVAGELVSLAAGALLLGVTAPAGATRARVASAVLLVGTGVLCLAATALEALEGGVVVANPRLAAGALVAAALALARFGASRGLPRALVAPLGVAAALVGFEAGRREVAAVVTVLDSGAWQAVLASVYAAVFAGGVLALGFARRAADLRWLALAGFGAIVLKVGLHDLASVSTPLRILVTGCLGLVLLTAAYAYARARRQDALPDALEGGVVGGPPAGATARP